MSALAEAQAQRAEALRVARSQLHRPDVDQLLDVAEWIIHGSRTLLLEAAELDSKIRTGVADVLVDEDQPHWWVIANRQDAGRDWCRRNGVPPYGAHTHIISTADAIAGHAIRPTDHVVFVGEYDELPEDVRFGVQLAQRAGGAL